jgi:signal transduction histidine kinase
LKLHLLVRMTVAGLLCWLGVSIYVVSQSGHRAARELAATADQLQTLVTADVMRRWISIGSDQRTPDLAAAAARFPAPPCLRYVAQDGTQSDWGCADPGAAPAVPPIIAPALRAIGLVSLDLERKIVIYGVPVGTLEVESDDAALLETQWRRVRDLLGLTAVTLLALDLLAIWIVGRALAPTAKIVAALEQLGAGDPHTRLPRLHPREFTFIADGINRLADGLSRANAARSALTARLYRVHEEDRRELAHELHEEFGQCVSALGAVSAGIRQSAVAGEPVTQSDALALERGVEQVLDSLRSLLERMSRPPLEGQGLRSAIADLVTAWRARHGAAHVDAEIDPDVEALASEQCALCAYRIVQECLSNVARHAPGTRCVRIALDARGARLRLAVSNDLDGAAACAAGAGMGLKLLDERVRSLQGSFGTAVVDGKFEVRAELPMEAE